MTPSSLEKATQASGEHEPAKVSSGELLAGRRQLIIQHGSEEYRLRLTSSNKLIMTK
jgi:hemin uptake protein HemP